MKREEHLKYCKICLNRKMDLNQGLVCILTSEIANFEDACHEFKEDPILKRVLESVPDSQEIETQTRLNNGSQWFLWIFGLSAINSLVLFSGGEFSFIFGLGFSQFFEGLFLGIVGELTLLGTFISILISSVFVLVWFFAKKLSKPAFIIGMTLYSLDAVLLLIFQDWLSFGVHLYALFMIFKGYQTIDALKEKQQIETIELESK